MYEKSVSGWLKHLDFEIIDIISLQLAFYLAYITRHGASNPYTVSAYRGLAGVLVFVDLFVMVAFESYKNVLKRGYFKNFLSALKNSAIVTGIVIMFLFAFKVAEDYSRITVFVMGIYHLGISYALRILWRARIRNKRANAFANSILIVGTNQSIAATYERFTNYTFGNYIVTGLVTESLDSAGCPNLPAPFVADYTTLIDYIKTNWVDEILIDIPSGAEFNWGLIADLADAGITVHTNLQYIYADDGAKREVSRIGGYTVITASQNMLSPGEALLKRLMDICGAIVGCILTLIFAIIIGPIIKIQSPGPIFFSQKRIGKNGRVFKMYKFRSMHLDAEERKAELMSQNRVKDGMMFKLDWDPRIIGNEILPDGTKKTGIGEFIRKTSIDEFPQFFNVLIGNMSLVGTRPPTLDEWAKYEAHHRARMSGRPGITGLWQTSGRSEIKNFEEVVRLDRMYLRDWNLGLDIKIILQTIYAVIKRQGAM